MVYDLSDFLKFSLDTIREGGSSMSWLEARRLELVPLLAARLRFLLEGRSFVLLCDEERAWYQNYILQKINAKPYRPLIPMYALSSLYHNKLKTSEDIVLLNDLLEITFAKGFVYFYIGTNLDFKFQIATSRNDSLLWIFDEELQNSFHLSSKDVNLDEKLISLFKLLDKVFDALLFGELKF